MPKSIPIRSLLHSLGVVVYVTLVATVMHYGNQWFGTVDTIFTSIAVLLLLCVSAATVGGLVFGAPAVWFLSGKRREGITLAIWIVGWLVLETVATLTIAAIR
jgi:hypothetical protein